MCVCVCVCVCPARSAECVGKRHKVGVISVSKTHQGLFCFLVHCFPSALCIDVECVCESVCVCERECVCAAISMHLPFAKILNVHKWLSLGHGSLSSLGFSWS